MLIKEKDETRMLTDSEWMEEHALLFPKLDKGPYKRFANSEWYNLYGEKFNGEPIVTISTAIEDLSARGWVLANLKAQLNEDPNLEPLVVSKKGRYDTLIKLWRRNNDIVAIQVGRKFVRSVKEALEEVGLCFK